MPRCQNDEIAILCHFDNGIIRFFSADEDQAYDVQHFRGSDNQRIIDVKKSLETGEVVHWDGEIQ